MKNSWIKVNDSLPELEYVSDIWSCSVLCLCTNGEDVFTAFYQQLYGSTYWDGYRRYTNITHWQPIELP